MVSYKFGLWSLILLLPLFLTGCGGHPAAGTWQIQDGSASRYARLVVQFDGKAEFFRGNEEEPAERCFWAGESADSITLQCVDAANGEERHYRLKVSKGGRGELMQDGRLLGMLDELE